MKWTKCSRTELARLKFVVIFYPVLQSQCCIVVLYVVDSIVFPGVGQPVLSRIEEMYLAPEGGASDDESDADGTTHDEGRLTTIFQIQVVADMFIFGKENELLTICYIAAVSSVF